MEWRELPDDTRRSMPPTGDETACVMLEGPMGDRWCLERIKIDTRADPM